jgi:hypothetical protein
MLAATLYWVIPLPRPEIAKDQVSVYVDGAILRRVCSFVKFRKVRHLANHG